jgi:cytochrome c peroxidase
MTKHRLAVFGVLLAGSAIVASCGRHSAAIDPQRLKAFAPLPHSAALTPPGADARVELGRMLYYEARLSRSQTLSCNSCHSLTTYGVDGHPTSEGHGGQRGTRNSPTVYNAAIQFAQFWDGRARDVEQQAGGPLLNPVEMAMPSEKAVVAVLNSMPGYVTAFRRAYPGEKKPVTFAHLTDSLGAFERGLVTPSRWDKYLQGDETALTRAEKVGFNHFLAAGCDTCHSGTLVGGNAFQKLGVLKEYPDTSDPGRYKVTQSQSDRMYFKVPPLRNVVMTGPYFHNGKVATVEEAVSQMAEYQTGNQLATAERDAIVTWLKSLTGEVDHSYIKEPDLPQSTSKTPRPKAEV